VAAVAVAGRVYPADGPVVRAAVEVGEGQRTFSWTATDRAGNEGRGQMDLEAENRFLQLDGRSALRIDMPEQPREFTVECWVRGDDPNKAGSIVSNAQASGFGLYWASKHYNYPHGLVRCGGVFTAPEPAPAVESVAAQSPAPAINLDPRGEPSQEPTVQPTPQPTVPLGRAIRPPGAAAAPTPAATARPAVVSRPPAAVVSAGRIENVNLTFYDCLDQGFCGNMKSGTKVYEGAAACSWNLPEGTRFRILNDPTKRTYVCEDRGILDDTWVDIFFYDPEDGWAWQKAVGRYGAIEIVKLP